MKMIKDYYKMIIDSKYNALNILPKAQQFQIMSILAWMWSAIFSIGIGSYYVFGVSVILHILVLLGIFLTYTTFKRYGK